MEHKESDRIVIAKPVASRPTSSAFGSFSELLAGTIDDCPPRAVRPKTAKPAINMAPHSPTSQAESSGIGPSCSSDEVGRVEKQTFMVFRPLAKVVSKATASLLASMGHFNIASQQTLAQVDNREKSRSVINQPSCNPEQSQPTEPQPPRPLDEHKTGASSSAIGDRLSSDGYNWRKYGQKQVKGSEYPRSYYKCTHSNCPVKKKVERSLYGEVAEIVYKGEHNHPKPTFPKRTSSRVQGQDFYSSNPDLNDAVNERNNGSEMRFSEQSSSAGKSPMLHDNSEVSVGVNGDPKSKRRKHGNKSNEGELHDGDTEKGCIWVRNNAEPEIMGDGFRWRKYGQKVVKGNPYPRSYYRCTSVKCDVRKHVERALDDPSAFITTYEGKHNHERP
ncbi:WRKY transcription factor 44-like isoform X2 [Silene latifolia]|uniref:WRKY transcription factor 44-like isoform X2 n=1 Tax=Silene latifolia TaxID=37657 RepID=UPI003D7764BF